MCVDFLGRPSIDLAALMDMCACALYICILMSFCVCLLDFVRVYACICACVQPQFCHWIGDCTLAVAGGVNITLQPDTYVALCRARMLSRTGQCQAFSANADGYVRGEGCGIVILKKLTEV
jgi:hypothetical protein